MRPLTTRLTNIYHWARRWERALLVLVMTPVAGPINELVGPAVLRRVVRRGRAAQEIASGRTQPGSTTPPGRRPGTPAEGMARE